MINEQPLVKDGIDREDVLTQETLSEILWILLLHICIISEKVTRASGAKSIDAVDGRIDLYIVKGQTEHKPNRLAKQHQVGGLEKPHK